MRRAGKHKEHAGTHGALTDESVLYNPWHSKDIPYSIVSFYL